MVSTCVTLSNPISEKREQTLFRVATLAERLGVPALLCGAFARDVLFWHMHGIHTNRETMDVDICVQVQDWAAFGCLGEGLRQNGFKNPYEEHPEKFEDEETGQELDLLPFGELAEDGKTIVWPQDNSRWSVVGLQEAFDHALHLEIKGDGQVRQLSLVSVPALVMLKIVAVHDRPEDRYKKDGTDIGFVIENYLGAGNKDRLKTQPNDDIMAIADGDLDMATAVLLGRDMAALVGAVTRDYILELLDSEVTSQRRCHLVRGLQKSHCRGDFTRARSILQTLAGGLRWTAGTVLHRNGQNEKSGYGNT